jgi:hypothetical protein
VRSSLDSTTCAWNHYRNSTSRSTTSWSRCRSPTSTSTSTSLDNRRKTRRQTRLESCLKLSSWNENQYNDTVAVPRRATRSTGRAGPAGAGGGIALPPRSTRSGAELRPRRRRRCACCACGIPPTRPSGGVCGISFHHLGRV